jgi:hypothetical protein
MIQGTPYPQSSLKFDDIWYRKSLQFSSEIKLELGIKFFFFVDNYFFLNFQRLLDSNFIWKIVLINYIEIYRKILIGYVLVNPACCTAS